MTTFYERVFFSFLRYCVTSLPIQRVRSIELLPTHTAWLCPIIAERKGKKTLINARFRHLSETRLSDVGDTVDKFPSLSLTMLPTYNCHWKQLRSYWFYVCTVSPIRTHQLKSKRSTYEEARLSHEGISYIAPGSK